jgi:hypothetical protein
VIDTTDFPEQEKLSKVPMARDLKMRIAGIDLKTFEILIDPFFDLHLEIAQFVSSCPSTRQNNTRTILARLHGAPVVIDQIIGVLKQGEKDSLTLIARLQRKLPR